MDLADCVFRRRSRRIAVEAAASAARPLGDRVRWRIVPGPACSRWLNPSAESGGRKPVPDYCGRTDCQAAVPARTASIARPRPDGLANTARIQCRLADWHSAAAVATPIDNAAEPQDTGRLDQP